MLKAIAAFLVSLLLRAAIFLLVFYVLTVAARLYIANYAYNLQVESSINFDDTLPMMGQDP